MHPVFLENILSLFSKIFLQTYKYGSKSIFSWLNWWDVRIISPLKTKRWQPIDKSIDLRDVGRTLVQREKLHFLWKLT